MNSWHSYPKIYTLGHPLIKDLFDGQVTIEEKVDGSQFSFGLFDGEFKCRSKGKEIDLRDPEKMFVKAIEYAWGLVAQGRLTDGVTYRCEFLSKPKHNTLAYNRVPHSGGLICFDIETELSTFMDMSIRAMECHRLGLECVPVLAAGMPVSLEYLTALLQTTSVLGGQKIEGVVVKNYSKFGLDGHPLMGKHVSEAFKEIHQGDWKERNPSSNDIIQRLVTKYRTPARWAKAVQHAEEQDRLESSPRDIGILIPAIRDDIIDECFEEMQGELWEWAKGKVMRGVTAGFPEWYKQKLLEKQFEEVN